MTQRISTLRPTRPVRGRSRCVASGASQSTPGMCDEAVLTQLMAVHLARLRHTPWAVHPQPCLGCQTRQLADALPDAYRAHLTEVHTPQGVKAPAHLPRLLNAELREIWLVQLWHAMDGVRFPLAHRAAFWLWAEALSVQLLAPTPQPRAVNRYPYAVVRAWFAGASHG